MTVTKTTPQAVSAAIHRAGFNVVPLSRPGVHVRKSFRGAYVGVCTDTSHRGDVIMADRVRAALTDAGYVIDGDDVSFYVTGRVSA